MRAHSKVRFMPSRPRHHFRHLPVSPDYLVATWPRAIGMMQAVSFAAPCSRRDLMSICRWAGLAKERRSGGPVPTGALRRLVALAARNSSGNSYHHAGHFAHVVMAAGVLAARAGLRSEERGLLVLAALVHDLDHQGRNASSKLYFQETLSAQAAVRVIGGRLIAGKGGDPRLGSRIHNLLRATALTNDSTRTAILRSDRLARLLTDADILASVVYPLGRSMDMTRALKLEQRLAGGVFDLNRRFARMIADTGLQSEVARDLLEMACQSRHPARNVINVV